jgi:hypothetical protein
MILQRDADTVLHHALPADQAAQCAHACMNPQALFTSYNFQCPLLVGLLQMAIIVPVSAASWLEVGFTGILGVRLHYRDAEVLYNHARFAPRSRFAMRWRGRGWRRRRSVPWCRWPL